MNREPLKMIEPVSNVHEVKQVCRIISGVKRYSLGKIVTEVNKDIGKYVLITKVKQTKTAPRYDVLYIIPEESSQTHDLNQYQLEYVFTPSDSQVKAIIEDALGDKPIPKTLEYCRAHINQPEFPFKLILWLLELTSIDDPIYTPSYNGDTFRVDNNLCVEADPLFVWNMLYDAFLALFYCKEEEMLRILDHRVSECYYKKYEDKFLTLYYNANMILNNQN